MPDDDMLGEINARARRKAVRRAVISVATLVPGLLLLFLLTPVAGFWYALVMGVGLSCGIAILLERKVPQPGED